jgi:hypothetical protein
LHTRDITTSETFCAEPHWHPSKTEHPTENKEGGKNVRGVGVSHVTTQKMCLSLQLQPQEKRLPSDKISPVLFRVETCCEIKLKKSKVLKLLVNILATSSTMNINYHLNTYL